MCVDCNEPIHHWFGLSYSSYFTIPRLALQNMPLDWQRRFVALMDEAEATGLETPTYTVQMRDARGRFVADPWRDYRCGDFEALKKESTQPNHP